MTLSPAHNGQTRLNVGDFDTTSIIRDEYSLEVNPVRFHGRNKYEKQLKDVKECLAVYYIMNLEFIEYKECQLQKRREEFTHQQQRLLFYLKQRNWI